MVQQEDISLAREALEVLTVAVMLYPSSLERLTKDRQWQNFINDMVIICRSRFVALSYFVLLFSSSLLSLLTHTLSCSLPSTFSIHASLLLSLPSPTIFFFLDLPPPISLSHSRTEACSLAFSHSVRVHAEPGNLENLDNRPFVQKVRENLE